MSVTTKLDALSGVLKTFEENPKKLDAEKLLTLHQDLLEAYPLLRASRDSAAELDKRIEHYLRQMEVGASSLRVLLLQLHATVFVWKAAGGLDLQDAYKYAITKRGDMTADTPYFRFVGVPMILDPINMPVPAATRLELLASIAQYMEIEIDAPPIFTDETPDSDLNELPLSMFALGLVRRWVEANRENLVHRGGSKENRLFHTHAFENAARANPTLRALLVLLGYLQRPSFWQRIKTAFRRAGSGLVSMLARLFRLLGASRRFAYLMLGLTAIALAVVFWAWVLVAERNSIKRFDEFAPRSEQQRTWPVLPNDRWPIGERRGAWA